MFDGVRVKKVDFIQNNFGDNVKTGERTKLYPVGAGVIIN
jgi:hypothetical protein